MGLSKMCCPFAAIMQHWDGALMAEYLFNLGIILIFYISLSTLYTAGPNKVVLSSPSFLLCFSGPDRHVTETQATLMEREHKERTNEQS